KSESSILDFKKKQYPILNDSQKIKTAAFIKDIISFSNTIRSESAHIIIGIEEKNNGDKEIIGLDQCIDDSIFQEKIKDKVFPVPIFSTYSIRYNNVTLGIIEIPVKKYSLPISPTIKMKGLEPGKIYFRRGTSNSEANGREIIAINKWLESLPDLDDDNTFFERTSDILIKISTKELPLSECIVQALRIAEKYNIAPLKFFCKNELTGWTGKVPQKDEYQTLSYRMNKVIISPVEFKDNPIYYFQSQQKLNELKEKFGVFEFQFLFTHTIYDIEESINRLNQRGQNSLWILNIPSSSNLFSKMTKNNNDYKIYVTRNTLMNVYNGIKQKLIDILINTK
ncbi:MAG: helix-turn-helix domain-containing protein, partial [Candidatus Woesearchaeota archaeon]